MSRFAHTPLEGLPLVPAVNLEFPTAKIEVTRIHPQIIIL